MTSPPRFVASPNQCAPTRGYATNEEPRFPGAIVKLSGFFGSGALLVQVSDVAATVVARSPSRIDVQIPVLAPGAYLFTVTTPGGSAVSNDMFQVVEFPVLLGLEPFGFSRDPSHEGIVITAFGQHLRMSSDEPKPRATCVVSPGFNPDVQVISTSVAMEVVGFDESAVHLLVPPIPDFDRFIGGSGFITLEFASGVILETENWEIKGL
jgi:hypothetical protein